MRGDLMMEEFPGETAAMLEARRIGDHEIVRDPIVPYQSHVVM